MFTRRKFFGFCSALAVMAGVMPAGLRAESEAVFNPDITALRKLSSVIAGAAPRAVHVTKVADTVRPANVVVAGADPAQKMTLARTVYQLVYPDNTSVMIDSGMDEETHRTFGKTEEPFYPDNYEQVKRALLQARLIILTHYHADHVAGVVRSDQFETLAPKTWASTDTADLMVTKPHKETIKIAHEKVDLFRIQDMGAYHPIAPGVVLIRAPGHTPDSKMIYIRTEDGREFIHSVDSGWSMENIRQEKMKNASWVREDERQLLGQYQWLNRVMREEKDIIVLCTHDNEQYIDFTARGILQQGLYTV